MITKEINEIKTVEEFKDVFRAYDKGTIPEFMICALLDTYDKDFDFAASGVKIPDCLNNRDSVGYTPNTGKTPAHDFANYFVAYVYEKQSLHISTNALKNKIYELVVRGWRQLHDVAGMITDESIRKDYLKYMESKFINAMCCILQYTQADDLFDEFRYFSIKMKTKTEDVMRRVDLPNDVRETFEHSCSAEKYLWDAYDLNMFLVNDVGDLPVSYFSSNTGDLRVLQYRDD